MLIRIRIRLPGRSFSDQEDGAVTVDWVVLTAAVVALAGAVYSSINGPTGSVANAISDSIGATPVETGL